MRMRRIGGHLYLHHKFYKNKSEAKAEAAKIRKQGWRARVAKGIGAYKDSYVVYKKGR